MQLHSLRKTFSAKDTYQKRFKDVGRLFEQIRTLRYFPEVPFLFYTVHKGPGNLRITPVFTWQDHYVYRFCTGMLVEVLIEGRIKDTFGAFRSTKDFLKAEDQDLEDVDESEYGTPIGTFNRNAWLNEWKEFQRVMYTYSLDTKYTHFFKFDITNFYGSIDLNRLENKLREKLALHPTRLVHPYRLPFVVNLLMLLLRHWNRGFASYAPTSVGLPANPSGDESRLLANFYLQEHDQHMKEFCDSHSCRYIRYADDQWIFASKPSIGELVLLEAATSLHRIGLNMNGSKIKRFNRTEFKKYWLFSLQADLDQLVCAGSLAERRRIKASVAKKLVNAHTKDQSCRWETVLKRLVGKGLGDLPPKPKGQIWDLILSNPNDLLTSEQYLLRLWKIADVRQKIALASIIKRSLRHEKRLNGPLFNIAWFLESVSTRERMNHGLPTPRSIIRNCHDISEYYRN